MRHPGGSNRHSDEAGITSIWTIPGVTPMADQSDVEPYDDELGAAVDAIDQVVPSCSGLTPADRTDWAGLLAAYNSIHTNFRSTIGGSGDVLYKKTTYAEILGQLEALKPQVAAWNQRISQACPAQLTAPLSLPSSPMPSGTASGGASGAAAGVGGITILGLAAAAGIAAGAFYFLGGMRLLRGRGK